MTQKQKRYGLWRRVLWISILAVYILFFVEKYTKLDLVSFLEILTWQQATLIFAILSILIIPIFPLSRKE